MTPKEKQLLLKDLCTRLPYGVKVKYIFDDSSYCPFELSTKILQECLDKGFLPYLRPMSSMTEEERKEYESFFSIGEYACGGSLYGKEYEYIADDYDDVTQSVFLIDWLNAHHFDYRGLIEKGLALEAKEGMYKTE